MSSNDLDINDDIWNLFNDFDNIKLSNKKEEINYNICINKDCNSSNINLYENTYICDNCNTLQEKYIDNQAEWRYYGNDDSKKSDPTRCGMPVNHLLPELSLGSIISNDYNTSYYMYKIRKYQKWK